MGFFTRAGSGNKSAQGSRQFSTPKPFLSPVGGWVSAQNLAAARPNTCLRLENWFPTTTGIRLRSGCLKKATIGTDPVESLMAYIGGNTRELFAADETKIFDITTVADPDVAPTPEVTGQTSGYYSFLNFATVGGNFMTAVNGTDPMLSYNGIAFYPIAGTALSALNYDAETVTFVNGGTLTGGTSGATATMIKVIDNGSTGTLWIRVIAGTFQNNEIITGSLGGSATADGVISTLAPAITGVDTSDLSHVWAYRNRQWFIEAGSMNVWALPVDSIGGAMIQVSLAGVFQLGGSLLTGGTWSMDAGDGLDDKLVIISTEGEVAIYQGSDPSDPADFSLVGRYVIPPPMGKRCMMSAGGDLIIGTEGGMVPISAAVTKDPAALSIAAVSRNIEPDWLDDAQERRTLPWEIIKWDSRKTIYITTPVTSTEDITPAQCYVINAETGAFAKNTGWNTRCGVMHDDFMYFGTNAGTIMQADVGGSDDGELIYHTYVGSWDHMGAISAFKETKLARAIFLTRAEFTPKVSISTDYTISLPVPPSAASPSGSPGEWDVGVWDLSLWDTGLSTYTVTTKWVAVQKSGYVLAPQVQVVSGSTIAPNAELVMFDLVAEQGNIVV